jgi:hypothetical protein
MARFIDGNPAKAHFLALKGAALDLGGLRLANATLPDCSATLRNPHFSLSEPGALLRLFACVA